MTTSFLTTMTSMRIFACGVVARILYNIGFSAFSDKLGNPKLIVISPDLTPPAYAWVFPEILNFMFLGLVGGLVGAACTRLNIFFYRLRWRRLRGSHKRWHQVLDVVFWTAFTATVWFALPYLYGCREVHPQCSFVGGVTGIYVRCEQLFCPDGYYSEIGSLLFPTIEQVARLLFDRSVKIENHISLHVLLTVAVVYGVLEGTVAGLYVPGGLFLPSIIIGAAYGRFWGVVMGLTFPSAGINPGVYAMIGAGSMLGGFSRFALMGTVLLAEMTGESTYLFPIIIATFIAKYVGNRLSGKLYLQHMDVEDIPILTEYMPDSIATVSTKHVLRFDDTSLCVIDKIKNVIGVLYRSKHCVIPVVDVEGMYAGIITRRAVIYALKYSPIYATREEAMADEPRRQKLDIFEMEDRMYDWKDTTDYAATLGELSHAE